MSKYDLFEIRAFPIGMDQVPAMMLVADLTLNGVHRAFHIIPFLWPFHAIHHSSRAMDWLAGSRLHVVDIIATRATIMVEAWPESLGIEGHPVPESFLEQLRWPFVQMSSDERGDSAKEDVS